MTGSRQGGGKKLNMNRTIKKVKIYASNVNIVDNNNLQVKIFNALLIALGAFAICYVLIIGNMIFNVVERQSLGMQSKNLSNEVGDLELKYLSMSNKVDIALSKEMGFQETKAGFAIRKSLTALNFTTNEL